MIRDSIREYYRFDPSAKPDADCLKDQLLTAFLGRRCPAAIRRQVINHIADCGRCGSRLKELYVEKCDQTKSSGDRIVDFLIVHRWLSLGALIAILSAAFLLWKDRADASTHTPGSSASFQIENEDPRHHSDQQQIEMEPTVGATLKRWNRTRGKVVDSGSKSRAKILIASPDLTYILDTKPTFQWQIRGSVTHYRLSLQTSKNVPVLSVRFDKSKKGIWDVEVTRSGKTSHVTSPLPIRNLNLNMLPGFAGLARGSEYRWTLDEMENASSGAQAMALAPSACVFKVADLKSVDSVRKSSAKLGWDHLKLGEMYYRFGLLEDATRELSLVQTTGPAQRLLNKILSIR